MGMNDKLKKELEYLLLLVKSGSGMSGSLIRTLVIYHLNMIIKKLKDGEENRQNDSRFQ